MIHLAPWREVRWCQSAQVLASRSRLWDPDRDQRLTAPAVVTPDRRTNVAPNKTSWTMKRGRTSPRFSIFDIRNRVRPLQEEEEETETIIIRV